MGPDTKMPDCIEAWTREVTRIKRAAASPAALWQALESNREDIISARRAMLRVWLRAREDEGSNPWVALKERFASLKQPDFNSPEHPELAMGAYSEKLYNQSSLAVLSVLHPSDGRAPFHLSEVAQGRLGHMAAIIDLCQRGYTGALSKPRVGISNTTRWLLVTAYAYAHQFRGLLYDVGVPLDGVCSEEDEERFDRLRVVAAFARRLPGRHPQVFERPMMGFPNLVFRWDKAALGPYIKGTCKLAHTIAADVKDDVRDATAVAEDWDVSPLVVEECVRELKQRRARAF